MEKLKTLYSNYKRQVILFSSIFAILLMSSFVFMGINNKFEASSIERNITQKVEEKNASKEISEDTIKIDIKGYVKEPGVYELIIGARVIDAIKAAGGLTEEAFTRYINLSKRLSDENVIIVNSKEEIDVIKKGENKEIYCEDTNSSCLDNKDVITNDLKQNTSNNLNNKSSDKIENNVNSLVNINTATVEELTALSGVGKSKAEKIIEYRNEFGNFKTIEDIKNVKGIGDTIYAKIKENITV